MCLQSYIQTDDPEREGMPGRDPVTDQSLRLRDLKRVRGVAFGDAGETRPAELAKRSRYSHFGGMKKLYEVGDGIAPMEDRARSYQEVCTEIARNESMMKV